MEEPINTIKMKLLVIYQTEYQIIYYYLKIKIYLLIFQTNNKIILIQKNFLKK